MRRLIVICLLSLPLNVHLCLSQVSLSDTDYGTTFPEQSVEYDQRLTDSSTLAALEYLKAYSFSILPTDPDKAIRSLEWMLQETRKHGADSLKLDCLNALKFLYREAGEYQNAVDATREIFIMDPASYREDPLWHTSMGMAFYRWGIEDSAQVYFRNAYVLSRSAQDTVLMSRSANNLGLLYSIEGAYEFAVDYFIEALSLSTIIRDTYSMAYNRHNLGRMFLRLNDPARCQEYLDSAYVLSVRNEYHQLASQIQLTRGELLLDEHNAAGARQLFEEALDTFARHGKRPLEAKAHVLLAKSFILEGDAPRALTQVKAAATILDQVDDQAIKAEQQLAAGEIYIALDQPDIALPLLRQAEKFAESQNRRAQLLKIYDALIGVHISRNDWKEASQLLMKRIHLQDDLDVQRQSRIVYEMESQRAQLKKDEEIERLKIISSEEESKARLRRELNIALIALLIGVLAVLIFTYLNLKRNKMIAAQDKELHRQQMQFKEQEKTLAVMQALVDGQEEERKRIAADLHDGLGTLLAAMTMQLESIERDQNPDRTFDKIGQIETQMREAYQEIRRISHNMMPVVLTEYGLAESIQNLCDQFDQNDDLEVNFQIVGEPIILSGSQNLMVYHIFQELLNNVIKHADASAVDVQIAYHPEQVTLMAEDNGQGYDKSFTDLSQSLGLRSIISRVNYLNGSLDVDTAPGKGTAVYIHFPVKGATQL